jgi:putative ABC transport system permease protein
MLKNYIKSAFRSLTKNKGFTAINILGLALGLCVCMLIVFYVADELGYDNYNNKADRIYRVNNIVKFGGSVNNYAVSPAPLAEAFRHDLPEVEEIARFRDRGGYKVRKGDHNIQEAHFVFADPSIFNVFTLPALHGDPVKALAEPKNAVITESMAIKYFATANAIGKTLTLNDTLLYKVGAVIKDVPKRSHFNYDFFLAMSGLDESKNGAWLSNNFNTYVLVKQGSDINRMAAKFPSMIRKYLGGQLQAAVHMDYDKFEANGDYYHLELMPLKKIHLYSSDIAELSANGNIQYVYIFSAVAIFILLIACVNFMNLSTARSANRAREVGVRKVLGSSRKQLISQFLSESVIVTFFATLIALAGAWALLPLFNQMADKQLLIDTNTLVWLLPSLLVVVLVIGCLAGSYLFSLSRCLKVNCRQVSKAASCAAFWWFSSFQFRFSSSSARW